MDADDAKRRFNLSTWRNEVPDSLDAQMIADAAAVFLARREDATTSRTPYATHWSTYGAWCCYKFDSSSVSIEVRCCGAVYWRLCTNARSVRDAKRQQMKGVIVVRPTVILRRWRSRRTSFRKRFVLRIAVQMTALCFNPDVFELQRGKLLI